jgi:hypothetical protein
MTLKSLIVTVALAFAALSLTAPAGAGWFDRLQGNDTGGIIPWSPETDQTYGQIAAAHCATYNKIALVTSVHAQSGDYIGFICAFPPGYDPRNGQVGWKQ